MISEAAKEAADAIDQYYVEICFDGHWIKRDTLIDMIQSAIDEAQPKPAKDVEGLAFDSESGLIEAKAALKGE